MEAEVSNDNDHSPDPDDGEDVDLDEIINNLDAQKHRIAARTEWVQHVDADRGDAPTHVPPGYHVRGTSVLRDGHGNPILTWEKTAQDKDAQLEALLAAVDTLGEKLPREPMVEAPATDLDSDLLCVYPLGDPHIGLYSWAAETGQNFDLVIAERSLVEAVDRLVMLAPAAETAIVLNLGDFFHSDSQANQTARAHNKLDVDSRWARVLSVGIRTMCRVIDRALEKHGKVVVRCEIGNHDDHTSIVLAITLAHHYADNPRVEINTSPAQFWRYRHGRCLIASTHGHTCKPKNLPAIMAADWPGDWGATEHRRWYVGHTHQEQVQEFPGVTVEVFRTLAAKDAWAAAAGYRSRRDMRLHVWHAERGLINWHRTEPMT
jgi:hypothetical protein